MCEFWISLIVGIAAGAFGFLAATFYFQPILRYRDSKFRLLSDLLFYANAVNADNQKMTSPLKEVMDKRFLERIEANRRHSAELYAHVRYLPWPYRRWLRIKGENPSAASADLMGLSNTSEWDNARSRIENICKAFKFPRVF